MMHEKGNPYESQKAHIRPDRRRPDAGAACSRGNICGGTKAPRIMPLGDSITDGFTVVGGYRIPLWYMLQEKGIVDGMDFVGPNGWYIDGVVDYNHAGYSGYTIADCPGRQGIYNFIDKLMTDYPADVVMLQIGTNDIISSYDLDHAGSVWSSLWTAS